jgi:hypothetical protein
LYWIEKVEQKFKKFFKNIFYFKNLIFTENSKYYKFCGLKFSILKSYFYKNDYFETKNIEIWKNNYFFLVKCFNKSEKLWLRSALKVHQDD